MKFKISTKALKAFLTLSILFCSSISPALVTSVHASQKQDSTRRTRKAKPANTKQTAPKSKPAVFREDPIAAQAKFQSGSYLQGTGNFAGAQTAYREAVKLDPKNALYHHALGSLLQQIAAPKPATTLFPRMNPLGPSQDYGETLRLQNENDRRAYALQNQLKCHERQASIQQQQQAIDRARQTIRDHGGVVPRQAPRPLVMGDPCPRIGLAEPGPVFRPQPPGPALTGPALPAPVAPGSNKPVFPTPVDPARNQPFLLPRLDDLVINEPLVLKGWESPSLSKAPVSLDEAVTELGIAAALESGNAVYHSDYAAILFRVEKHNQAETEYRTAALLQPLNAGYHHSLGTVLEAELKWAEAAIAYNNALQLEPKNTLYKTNYKYAKKMAKKHNR